jgi:hypothetical protein
MTEETENQSPESSDQDDIELTEGFAESIQAKSVNMRQSGANSVNADVVDMHQSGAGQVNAQQVSVQQAFVGSADATTLAVNQGAVALGRAEDISVIGGAVGVSVSGTASLQDSQVAILAAQEVKTGPVSTILLVSGKVEGPVETMFDTRQTLLFGVVTGLTAGLVMALKRLIFRSRKS